MSKSGFSKNKKVKTIKEIRSKFEVLTTYDINLKLKDIRNKLISQLELDIDNLRVSAFQFIDNYIDKRIKNQIFIEKLRNYKNQCKKVRKILLDKFLEIKDILPRQIKKFINEKITSITNFIISNSRVLRI